MEGRMTDDVIGWITDWGSTVGARLLVAALWVAAAFWLGGIARRWVARAMTARSIGLNGAVLISRLASIAIRIAGILLALNVLGVSGTGLLAVVSAFTVAIGLSLQDVLKNFFAGIYLLMERPFRVGDRIVVRDVAGEVQGIDIRTTLLRNQNRELVLIPNATVFTEILRNDTFYGVRRVEFLVRSAERSLELIERQIHEALSGVADARQPIPAPRIVSSDADGLTVVMSLVVDNTDEAQNRVAEAVIAALPGDTIEVTTA